MILFLRNKKNESIVDIEIYVKKTESGGSDYVELHSVVAIEYYSEFLLQNIDRKDEIISDFSELDELRGWLWESFLSNDNTGKEYNKVVDAVSDRLKEIGKKYDLFYVTD